MSTIRLITYCTVTLCLSLPTATASAQDSAPTSPKKPAAEQVTQSLAEARKHWLKGRTDEALEVYEELEKQGVEPVRVAIGISQCHSEVGNWTAATKVLRTAIEKQKPDAALSARLAQVEFHQGRWDEAQKQVDIALKLKPDDPLARLIQAELHAVTGQLKQADEGYRWFVRYYNQAQPEDPEVLLLVARGSLQYARWHSVSRVFDFVLNTLCADITAKDADDWRPYAISGKLLLEKYNQAEAIPELRQALTINPRAAEVHAALAWSAFEDHKFSEAEQHADRALAINPHLIDALLIKADLKIADGDVGRALDLLKKASAVNPREEEIHARFAMCELLEDGPPAKDELREILAHLDAINEVKLTKPSRFGQRLIQVAKQNPHPGIFLTRLAQLCEQKWRFALAEQFFRQALISMPQLAEPKTNLGLLYMRVGKVEEASKLLDQAFEADPFHVRVSNMRKVVKLLDTYETITTEHFIIRLDSQADRILGKYMAEYLEEIYPDLVKQFGYEPPTRTQFEIYNKSKGLTAHQWFSARLTGLPWIQTIGASTGMIVALSSPTSTDKQFNWARVLKHEFVHILTLQQTDFNIPHWYTEALAVTSEGYPRPEIWDQLLVERVAKGDLMNLDNINMGFIRPKTPLDWQMAYCQSFLYAQYLRERFGEQKPKELLEAYKEQLPTDKAIRKVCGVSQGEFEKGYRNYLDELALTLRASSLEETKSLAVLEKEYDANPKDLTAAGRYAHELLRVKRLKEAREIASEVNDKDKAEPWSALVLAQLELRGEDVKGAITYLEPALDKQSPQAKVLELLAKLKLREEDFASAAELYELGHRQAPSRPAWLQGLATVYLKQKDNAKLQPVLEKLAMIDGDDAVVRKKLAQLALDRGAAAEAITWGKKSLHVDVMDAEIHHILAKAYTQTKQPTNALFEWEVAVELKPNEATWIVELARAEAAQNKKPAAIARLKKLLDKQPEFAPAKQMLQELTP